MRGRIRTDVASGIAPEYVLMTRRCFGDDAAQTWLDQLGPMCHEMARIFLRPSWVGIVDLETGFPSALEEAMEAAQA